MPSGPARITVWTADPDAVPAAAWPRLAGLLDDAERARAARLRAQRQWRERVAAHALKRLLLSALAGGAVAPAAWRFVTGAHGRPEVAGGDGLCLGLSHCDGLVACAVSHSVAPGLDVERADRPASDAVIAAVLTPAERASLQDLAPAARQAGFQRLWTLKEAVLKASGCGLSRPPRSVVIGLDPPHLMAADPVLGPVSAWSLVQRRVGTAHLLALAWSGGAAGLAVTVEPVRLAALLDPAG